MAWSKTRSMTMVLKHETWPNNTFASDGRKVNNSQLLHGFFMKIILISGGTFELASYNINFLNKTNLPKQLHVY